MGRSPQGHQWHRGRNSQSGPASAGTHLTGPAQHTFHAGHSGLGALTALPPVSTGAAGAAFHVPGFGTSAPGSVAMSGVTHSGTPGTQAVQRGSDATMTPATPVPPGDLLAGTPPQISAPGSAGSALGRVGRDPDPTPPGSLARSQSMMDLHQGRTRSNSVDAKTNPLRAEDRHVVKDVGSPVAPRRNFRDMATYAIYSREASQQFANSYRGQHKDGIRVTSASPQGQQSYIGRQRVVPDANSDLTEQVGHLLDRKVAPHLLTVIEGQVDRDSVDLNLHDHSHQYVLKDSAQGKKKAPGSEKSTGNKDPEVNDDKQTMSIFVRKDMENVYSVSRERIKVGDDSFPVLAVTYDVEADDKSGLNDIGKFQHLFVHIPNRFVNGKDKATKRRNNDLVHEAMQNYALDRKTQGITVTGYSGDTNFNQQIQHRSSPSVGGVLPDGKTINPQASSAGSDRHFMQSASLATHANASFRVLQPSTTNLVLPRATTSSDRFEKIGVDHPSMIARIGHFGRLARRNEAANVAFYGKRPHDQAATGIADGAPVKRPRTQSPTSGTATGSPFAFQPPMSPPSAN